MLPIKGGVITSPFDEMRPLSAPPAKRWHIHGALDIARGDGVVLAPVDGEAQAFVIFRGVEPGTRGHEWGADEKPDILAFPWHNYWFEIYGGFITLIERGSGRLHILCHFWPARILNHDPEFDGPFHSLYYLEERKVTSHPCHMEFTDQVYVKRGQRLAPVGSAGQSTGPHVHWEIHNQVDRLDDYSARVRPTEYL